MSISKQTLSIIIVTFKSDHVIHDCIQSISDKIKIIIVDNSNDKKFKENIEKKYNNVECILSERNLGMGPGNNLGLKYVKTNYVLILNPDIVFEKNSIQEIIDASNNINCFSILAPLANDIKYPNYKVNKKNQKNINDVKPFKVNSVDGFAMVLNLSRINRLDNFKNQNYFDENFFMYLENDDFCKRLTNHNENIYIVPKSKIKHLGGKAVNHNYEHEVELSRNWHWIWSKFYYNKKHYGFLAAFLNGFLKFFAANIKILLYLILNKSKKRQIYQQRVLGFVYAMFGKKSSYRPKIDY